MGFLCRLGRHDVVSRGIRNQDLEFGRCGRCRRDLVRKGDRWKPVPRGYRVVWRPRTGDPIADAVAGAASVGREVTVKGVVVAERAFGSQRFALVRLNADDERKYVDSFDRLGLSDAASAKMDANKTPNPRIGEACLPKND